MNGFYEIALHTVVLVWFWWILILTVLSIVSNIRDIIKLIRKHIKKHEESDPQTKENM